MILKNSLVSAILNVPIKYIESVVRNIALCKVTLANRYHIAANNLYSICEFPNDFIDSLNE